MFEIDRRFIYILLGCLVLFSIFTYSTGNIVSLLFTIPPVIIAITFHEFAHAWMADKLGDETPRMQGRLTLNPLSHLDPVGFVLLMFAGFGWGKPVQIDTRNFNRNVSVQKGEVLVSLAGPVMNFILAILFAVIFGAVYMFASSTFFASTIGNVIYILLKECVIMNIGLGVFNLIPLPPLDGSKIFINLFSYNARRWIMEHEQIFYYIFLGIWITGLAGIIISPIINFLYSGLMNGILAIFRLF